MTPPEQTTGKIVIAEKNTIYSYNSYMMLTQKMGACKPFWLHAPILMDQNFNLFLSWSKLW